MQAAQEPDLSLTHFRPELSYGDIQNAASDQNLQCLPTGIYMENTLTVKHSLDTLQTKNELIQMIRTDKCSSQKRIKISSERPQERWIKPATPILGV